ncbi:hypothetical protein GVX81_09055 [[Haemophilus] felis]|uniref:Uncharacterized protein n=1 Tax=[Haemophilus] felis TaxID=123822 RepID=A0A1T0AWG7_9PAST|nr:hypothetical protein [[Haemophilus] felis]OOS01136.1 hypothetical protein B0188_10135 [[Haemophilus] felis]
MRKNCPLFKNVISITLQNLIKPNIIESTTTIEGKHYPYSSAFFISQIPINGLLTRSISEFVKWLISGNKATSRTNNASRSIAVVETISHPLQGGNLFTNKTIETIKMKTFQKHTALTPTGEVKAHCPTLGNPQTMGVAYV